MQVHQCIVALPNHPINKRWETTHRHPFPRNTRMRTQAREILNVRQTTYWIKCQYLFNKGVTMQTDLYTKAVLTVIALALSAIALQNTIPSAFAQSTLTKVIIC